MSATLTPPITVVKLDHRDYPIEAITYGEGSYVDSKTGEIHGTIVHDQQRADTAMLKHLTSFVKKNGGEL